MIEINKKSAYVEAHQLDSIGLLLYVGTFLKFNGLLQNLDPPANPQGRRTEERENNFP